MTWPALVVIVALAFAPWGVTPAGAEDPNGFTGSNAYFASADGTPLHAWVWRPAGVSATSRTPVLLFVGPYSGGLQRRVVGNPAVRPPSLAIDGRAFERGYTVVEVDLRGTGASGGCVDLGGPGEQADARAAVEWAAAQPWSDGRVGMGGGSYVGWTQFMAAADPPEALKAIAPVSGLSDLYSDSLFSNGIAHQNLQTGLALTYLLLGLVPPGPEEGPQGMLNPLQASAARPDCGTDGLVETMFTHDPEDPFFRARNLVPRLRDSTVPMFVTHGFADFRVRPSSLLDFWPDIRAPRRAWLGQWGHAGPSPRSGAAGRQGWLDEVMAFYDHHVKGLPATGQRSQVTVQEGDGRWRLESTWPPPDVRERRFAVAAGSYLDAGNPVGVDQYTDDGNLANQAEANEILIGTDPERLAGNYWPLTGWGTWTITEPFDGEGHLAGRVGVEVQVTVERPDVPLVALLYEIDAEGQGWFITRGAYLIPGTGRHRFDLMPQDWRIEPGHRLGLLLTNNDHNWFNTVNSNTEVQVGGGSLVVPFLQHRRTAFVDGTSNAYVDAQQPIQVPGPLGTASTEE